MSFTCYSVYRDFCFIENVRQINLLAATVSDAVIPAQAGIQSDISPTNQVYNVAVGDRTTLNHLYEQLQLNLLPLYPHLKGSKPVYRDSRADEVRHSLADISKAAKLLGYQPTHRIGEGLKVAMAIFSHVVCSTRDAAKQSLSFIQVQLSSLRPVHP